MRLAFKGDTEIITQLEKAGLEPFELYVRNSKDLEGSYNNFIALHFHYKLDDGRTINLADAGELGNKSEEMLRKSVGSAKRNGIKKVVFHPPSVDLTKISKKEAIKVMARRLERIHDHSVLLCIENVCLWISQSHTKEPLFVEPEDYFKIIKEAKMPLGLTFDIEHFCVTAVMKLFYDKYKCDLVKVNAGVIKYEEVVREFENGLRGDFQQQCHNYLSQALEKLKSYISHVHVCGSDFTKYFFNPQSTLPLIGEHLPINFSGKSYGYEVKDRIDHRIWIDHLKETDVDVVMEIGPKEGYNFIELLQSSKNYLESLKLKK